MKSCRDLDSLLTPYVDGEVTPEQCAAIEAHLAVCSPCRRRADAEAGARAVVRRCRDRLREPAPPSLHAACRKLARQPRAVGEAGAAWPDATGRAGMPQLTAYRDSAARDGVARDSMHGDRAYGDHARDQVTASAAPLEGAPLDGTIAHDGSAGRRARTWRWWAPISIAATLLLGVAGAVVFGLVSERSTALAQDLATDHLRCVRLVTGRPPADRVELTNRWQRNRGWSVTVPPSSPNDDMQFVALRRCRHGGGEMAHALYRHQGRLVSLFIFPDGGRWSANREIMGQRAAIWSQHGRTYAVVDDGSSAEIERLKVFFSRAAE